MRLPRLLLVGVLATAKCALPANYRKTYSDYASQLSNDLLANYVKSQPPTSDRSVDYSKAGTDVKLQLRFFKLDSIDAAHGSMRIKIWWRMSWTDQRLSWDPAAYGGVSQVKFHASTFADPETTEIWLPDATAYNALEGLMASFDPAMAVVESDGTVFWSRPGIMSIMCRFSGLAAFPYGDLSCPIEVGGWANSGAFQGIDAMDDGCSSLVYTEEVSLASYTEYQITHVECTKELYEYPSAPNEPWPVMKFRVMLKRSTFYYVNMYIMPCVVFTILSFAVFFMSFQVGERLGFGVTLCLTSEVSKAAMVPIVPACGELLWMELFLSINLLFTIFSLLQSCIVLGIAYNTEDYLVPPQFNFLAWPCFRRLKVHLLRRQGQEAAKKFEEAKNPTSAAVMRLREITDSQEKCSKGRSKVEATDDMLAASARLLFFENLFYRLDPSGQGFLSADDARRVLGFTALGLTAEEFEVALFKADSNERDGKLDKSEFVELCVDVLWNVEVEQLESAASNYAANEEALVQRRNTRWRRIANNMDRRARFWVPFLYLLAILWLFSVDLGDDYALASSYNNSVEPVLMTDAWDVIKVIQQSHFIPLTAIWLALFILVILRMFCGAAWHSMEAKKVADMLERSGTSSLQMARKVGTVSRNGNTVIHPVPDVREAQAAVRGGRMPPPTGSPTRGAAGGHRGRQESPAPD